MNSLLRISLFKNASDTTPREPLTPAELIECIRGDELKEPVENLRRAKQENRPDDAARIKLGLPAVTITGVFVKPRRDIDIQEYTGLLPMDIDRLPGGLAQAELIRDQLAKIPEVAMAFVSPGGEGVKFAIKVNSEASSHGWAYEFTSHWVGEKLDRTVSLDERNKNISRLAFLSHDPGAYHNPEPVPLAIPPKPAPTGNQREHPREQPWPSKEHRVGAEEVLGVAVEWLPGISDKTPGTVLAHVECPGKSLHTQGDGEKDCCLLIGTHDPIVLYCFHHHCREETKRVNAKLAFINKDSIYLPGTGYPLSRWSTEVGRLLSNRNHWFNRAQVVVAIEEASEKNFRHDDPLITTNLLAIEPITALTHLEIALNLYSSAKKSRGALDSMDLTQANALLHSPQLLSALPKLDSVECAIVPFRYGNTVKFPTRGYNPDLQTWISASAPEPQEIASREEAAKILLEDLWEDFPFKEEIVDGAGPKDSIGRRHALAFLLTGFTRNLFYPLTATTPLFLVQANSPRSGKDALCNLVQLVNTGKFAELGLPAGNEEFDKLMLGLLLRGARHLHFSNIRGDLNLTSLERFLTSEFYHGRRLGGNHVIEVPRTCLTSMSANVGYSVSPDLRARSLPIDLHITEADPNQRVFHRPNLLEEVQKQRPRVLGAMTRVVQTWIEEGMPMGQRAFATAPEWQRVVGGIMRATWGFEPEADTTTVRIGTDPVEESWEGLCELILEQRPRIYMKAKEIRDLIQQHNGDANVDEFLFPMWLERAYQGQQLGYLSADGARNLGLLLAKKANRDFRGGKVMVGNPTARSDRKTFAWVPLYSSSPVPPMG